MMRLRRRLLRRFDARAMLGPTDAARDEMHPGALACITRLLAFTR